MEKTPSQRARLVFLTCTVLPPPERALHRVCHPPSSSGLSDFGTRLTAQTQLRYTTAFVYTSKSSHYHSWHSVCILTRNSRSSLPTPSYYRSIFPFTVSFHSFSLPNSHSLVGPPSANLGRGHVCSWGVPDTQHPETPPPAFSRTNTLCPKNTPEFSPPMIKWVLAATSGSVPALVGERSIQVAGHSAARSFGQTLEAGEGKRRR